jgi:hypothetical protein
MRRGDTLGDFAMMPNHRDLRGPRRAHDRVVPTLVPSPRREATLRAAVPAL